MLVQYSLLACLVSSLAVAAPHKTSVKENVDASARTEYTVLLSQGEQETPEIHAVLAQVNMTTDSEHVFQVYNNSAFRGFSVHVNSEDHATLSNMTSVAVMEKTVKLTSAVASRTNSPWGLERISTGSSAGSQMGLTSTYMFNNGSLGQGADVYIIDTGIFTENVGFAGRAVNGFPSANVTDTDGHGTHVAGIAASNPYGVASMANIIGVDALMNGTGTSSSVIAGIDFVVQQHDAKKASGKLVGSVISMSLSTPYGQTSSSFTEAINAAVKVGIHVVVAAGNDGMNACGVSPAEAAGTQGAAIAVGSIGFNNTISSFSNTGPCVDVYAPGEDVLSTFIGNPNATQYLSGTSMAAPHVSGIVAYQIASNATLAQDPAAMKLWVKNNALKGIVGGKVIRGDLLLLANNGVTVGPALQAARAKLAAAAVNTTQVSTQNL